MNRFLSLLLFLFLCATVTSARVNEIKKISFPYGKFYMFRVSLTDKKGSAFTTQQPEKYLSPRALSRRKQQNIKVDSTDLPVSPTYIDMIKAHGFEVIGRSKWNNTVLVRSRQPEILTKLNSLNFIKGAVLVYTSPDSIRPHRRSNYHKEFNQWEDSIKSTYGTADEQIKSLGGTALHKAGFNGKGKMIAVLDGGFMNVDKIPAFSSVNIIAAKDFVIPPSKDIYKEMEHGTMVLSTMAANVPGTYMGTAPQATYTLIRCEDEQGEYLCEEDYWAEAAEFADSIGADIINSSIGYHGFDDKKTNHKYSDLDGEKTLISHTASMLAAKGIILVCSAGNDGMGTWKKITFPADARNIITVGAITPDGTNAPFSAVGPTADQRVKPDMMAYGSPVSVITGRGTIIGDMGTSFAAPLVSGMVACLWQSLPNKSAFDIINLIKMSCSQYNTPDNIYGYGVPNFELIHNSQFIIHN